MKRLISKITRADAVKQLFRTSLTAVMFHTYIITTEYLVIYH